MEAISKPAARAHALKTSLLFLVVCQEAQCFLPNLRAAVVVQMMCCNQASALVIGPSFHTVVTGCY